MSERVHIHTLLREFQEKSAASSRISLDIRRLFESIYCNQKPSRHRSDWASYFRNRTVVMSIFEPAEKVNRNLSRIRAARRAAQKQWRDRMEAVLTEASGLLGIVIVRIGGPKPSEEIMQLLFRWGCELMALGEPMPCIACGTGALYPSAEKSPAGWLIVIPARADWGLSSSGTENLHKLAVTPHRHQPCAGRAAAGVHLGRQSRPLRQPRGLARSMASRPSMPVEPVGNRESPRSAEPLRYARDQLVCP